MFLVSGAIPHCGILRVRSYARVYARAIFEKCGKTSRNIPQNFKIAQKTAKNIPHFCLTHPAKFDQTSRNTSRKIKTTQNSQLRHSRQPPYSKVFSCGYHLRE